MKMLINLLVSLIISCSHTEFQREATAFQEEAESYYLLQRMIAGEFTNKLPLKKYNIPSAQSMEFIKSKEHDLIGWTNIEKDPTTGHLYGLCITPVYANRKKIGYIVGKYRFKTELKESTLASCENSLLPVLHEKLKYSYRWMILPKVRPRN